MMKLMLCSYHSQIHGLMRVKATGVEPPLTPIVFGLCSSLAAAPVLIPVVLSKAKAGAPPNHVAVTGRLADHGEKS